MSSTGKGQILLLITTLAFLGACTTSPKQPISTQPATSKPTSTPIVIPTKSFVVNIPDKALLRNYVEVSVKANPGTNCELTYVPPAGQTRQSATTADSSGLCVWKWQLDALDGKGNARLIFTINGISETHFLEVRSSF